MMDIQHLEIMFCEACVVGAGAAGLNAADELKVRGVNALVVCDDIQGGVSLNSGSDKQTYYKLSLSGSAKDSVSDLAASFFAGGGMHGHHAYAMAASSAECFLKLASLGVAFPKNAWGEYVGYRTDHDEFSRATSAGPLTSRMMGEALLRSVKARGVPIVHGARLVSILKDGEGRAVGALFLKDGKPLAVCANAVILATGGMALAYEDTVYPAAQVGASGAAIRAGAKMNNLCYWQYGLASTDVKWNVSGSYQQAIPNYETEIGDLFESADMINEVFLKGYQWPFDSRKMGGSSRVDLAVLERTSRGERVYMNFRKERADVLDLLNDEARTYLKNCDALVKDPYRRILLINTKAAEFYAERGIDLSKEPLRVAVCAQHQNGGIAVDEWWRTSIDGLYAAGECAGAFGIYRPGGSALNETQVGSLRVARHVAAHRRGMMSREDFLRSIGPAVSEEWAWLSRANGGAEDEYFMIRRGFSRCAGALRDIPEMARLKDRADALLDSEITGATPESALINRDVLTFQSAALSAMLCQAEFAGDAGHGFVDRSLPKDAPQAMDYAFETGGGITKAMPLGSLPEGGGWFERVWAAYQSGEIYR